MEKPCRQFPPNYFASRDGFTDPSISTPEMGIGNDVSTVIDMDDHPRKHSNGFLLNGTLPNGVHPTVAQTNGALPDSAIKKIAIEIAEASAAYHYSHPPRFEPELFKTLLTVLYCMFVSFMSAFTITYTHDRLPDAATNPPLPDLVFDVVPRMEWAFLACEIGMVLLVAANVINLTFHKHRLIVLRRFLVIVGLAYTLRCVTMVVTSLPVTGDHVHCGTKMFDSVWSRLGRAIAPSLGMGMTMTGQREEMCGDYMYSGHTISIMTACLFFTEYTPSRCRLLHLLVWLTGGASLFLIVAAHEHYTVDVLIAMIVVGLMFLYYHTLVNTRAHLHRDVTRVHIWFPFFYYLEAKVDGVVPNEYEWPFRCPSLQWLQATKVWHRSKSGLVD